MNKTRHWCDIQAEHHATVITSKRKQASQMEDTETDPDKIKTGDFVVVQRQSYTKLHKIKPTNNTIKLGVLSVELNNAIGCKYFETFQMRPKASNKKLYDLEKTTGVICIDHINIEQSGVDNRDITDDGSSQTLSREEIEELKDTSSSNEILEKLVANSKTFAKKTGYSQEKYLKKKEKKYFGYVRLRRPSIRLLMQMFYRQEPQKILGMRIDDLSQLLMYSGVQSVGNYVLYDSGTSGLITAAVLDRIGENTEGRLVHMHPGNECQKNAVVAMQFPQEQLARCINVNVYSVLRWFYQNGEESLLEVNKEKDETNTVESEVVKKEVTTDNEIIENEELVKTKKRKHEEDDDNQDVSVKKKPCWHFENDRACEILREKIDSLIIVSKEHPVSLVKELGQFLKPSRTLVAFHSLQEPLMELYSYLKEQNDFINIQLVNNFMRSYQVLPERTHPLVNMSSGGHLLYAYKIDNKIST